MLLAEVAPTTQMLRIGTARLWHFALLQSRYAGTARPGTGSGLSNVALENFHRRAGCKLIKFADTSSTFSTMQVSTELQVVKDEELQVAFGEEGCPDERQVCEVQMTQKVNKVTKILTEVDDLRKERRQLENERADALVTPFQNSTGENMEFGSLVVCAAAGIFACTIHYYFFSIFGLAFYFYRRATKAVREQHEALARLDEILEYIQEINAEEKKHMDTLFAQGKTWAHGSVAASSNE